VRLFISGLILGAILGDVFTKRTTPIETVEAYRLVERTSTTAEGKTSKTTVKKYKIVDKAPVLVEQVDTEINQNTHTVTRNKEQEKWTTESKTVTTRFILGLYSNVSQRYSIDLGYRPLNVLPVELHMFLPVQNFRQLDLYQLGLVIRF